MLASRIGSLEELVDEGVTGRKFAATDAEVLAKAVRIMLNDEVGLRRMRANARAYFEAHLTEQANYTELMNIYSDVIAEAGHPVRFATQTNAAASGVRRTPEA